MPVCRKRSGHCKMQGMPEAHTWNKHWDVLSQSPREHIYQLCQHVEAALPGLHTLLLHLFMQGFHDHGHLHKHAKLAYNLNI